MEQTIDKIEQRFGDISQYNYIKFTGAYLKNKGTVFCCATFYEFVKENNGNITQLGMKSNDGTPDIEAIHNISRSDFIDRIKQMEFQGMLYDANISCVDNDDNLQLAFSQI